MLRHVETRLWDVRIFVRVPRSQGAIVGWSTWSTGFQGWERRSKKRYLQFFRTCNCRQIFWIHHLLRSWNDRSQKNGRNLGFLCVSLVFFFKRLWWLRNRPRSAKLQGSWELTIGVVDIRLAETRHRKRHTLWLCQNSYWKWPLIVDLAIKYGDFP